MIPPVLSQAVKSNAERLLFEALNNAELPDEYVCLHSVNLPEHEYKVCGELDFVVVSPRGLYVIEVKGGGVSCVDGIWRYIDRWGHLHQSSEGPIKQASSGMHSLRERLKTLIAEKTVDELTMGFGVAFPQCDFNQTSTEWQGEWILDAQRLTTTGVAKYLKKLESHWHAKFPGKPARCDLSVVKAIVRAIRPDFEMALSLRVESDQVEANLTRLTEEQYAHLDIIEHCDRIFVEGGAGTGKTFLAMELAQRHTNRGERVLFICFSPVLASYLRRINQTGGLTIRSVHGIMLETVKSKGTVPDGYSPTLPITDPWYSEFLSPAFELATRHLPEGEKYDVLVVDEGQDILNLHYITALDNLLKNGFENGVWRMFYDPVNQGAIYRNIDLDVVQMLKGYGPVPPRLRVNCRNTDPIVLMTKLMTGAEPGTQSAGAGPDVELQYYEGPEHAARLLESYLQSLSEKGISDSEITILSPLTFEESSASTLSRKWIQRIVPLRNTSADSFPNSRLTFSTIADFKGLENRFIALTDIEAMDSAASVALLYVGMTRARVKLWVAMNVGLKARQKEIIEQNMSRLME